ncbi:MAG: nuclease A inhibitor family protein [Cyanobacteria bacterium P01_C01_bin.121]
MTARPLKAKLENACKDLWWSSEADYPVEVVWCEIPESQCPESGVLAPALVRQVVGCAEDAAVTSQLFDSLFDKYLTPKRWHTAEDKQQLNQLRALKTLLSENISNLQVYRCGEVEITLCILGYVSTGILAGVKTCLVET